MLAGGAAVAGIGFTVSLLISSLAFSGERLDEAKLGVLASAVLAPALAWVIFRATSKLPASVRARQILGTAEQILDLAEDVDPERDHIRGPEDAPVTLVEYGDFQCPVLRAGGAGHSRAAQSIRRDVRYVWRHLPLNDVHPNAQLAAEAAEAAGAQGKFWDMYDALLSHQDDLSPHKTRTASRSRSGSMSSASGMRCAGIEYAPRVAEDVASADASGVSGTPSFFINGRRHQGAYDIDTLTAAVKAALRRARLLEKAAA